MFRDLDLSLLTSNQLIAESKAISVTNLKEIAPPPPDGQPKRPLALRCNLVLTATTNITVDGATCRPVTGMYV